MPKIVNGQRLNNLEASFYAAWLEHGLPDSDLTPHTTITLDVDGVRWPREFDFGSRASMVLIECDGLGGYDAKKKMYRCGNHQTPKGLANDAQKRNAAVAAGWRVLVFPTSLINNDAKLKRAVEQVVLVMCDAK